jgi:hypothetical protein
VTCSYVTSCYTKSCSRTPLGLIGKEIRLFRLLPSVDFNVLIEGELIHVSLKEKDLCYKVLYYELGDVKVEKRIILDSYESIVRENLFNALSRIDYDHK